MGEKTEYYVDLRVLVTATTPTEATMLVEEALRNAALDESVEIIDAFPAEFVS